MTESGLSIVHRELIIAWHGLASVERLDLRLLIDAKHDGVGRRRDVKADHIAHLGDEVLVCGELEGLQPVRPAMPLRAVLCTREA